MLKLIKYNVNDIIVLNANNKILLMTYLPIYINK